ncbi:hypothetical protein EMCRGX_G002795 [Ephydatia muelleri]
MERGWYQNALITVTGDHKMTQQVWDLGNGVGLDMLTLLGVLPFHSWSGHSTITMATKPQPKALCDGLSLYRLELHLGLQLPPQCEADLRAGPGTGTTERRSHPSIFTTQSASFNKAFLKLALFLRTVTI